MLLYQQRGKTKLKTFVALAQKKTYTGVFLNTGFVTQWDANENSWEWKDQ